MALVLAAGFAAIYIPVIAGEERFLRGTFAGFEEYCRRVPRLIPRLGAEREKGLERGGGKFSFSLYLKHREYNAGVGAALLYLCLLWLRPVLATFFHGPR